MHVLIILILIIIPQCIHISDRHIVHFKYRQLYLSIKLGKKLMYSANALIDYLLHAAYLIKCYAYQPVKTPHPYFPRAAVGWGDQH